MSKLDSIPLIILVFSEGLGHTPALLRCTKGEGVLSKHQRTLGERTGPEDGAGPSLTSYHVPGILHALLMQFSRQARQWVFGVNLSSFACLPSVGAKGNRETNKTEGGSLCGPVATMCRELKRSINSNFCAAKSKVKIKGVGENGNQKSEGDSSPVCPTVKPGFGSSLSGLGRLCPLGLGGESQEARAGAWIDRMGEAWQPLFSMSWFLGSRGLGAQ